MVQPDLSALREQVRANKAKVLAQLRQCRTRLSNSVDGLVSDTRDSG